MKRLPVKRRSYSEKRSEIRVEMCILFSQELEYDTSVLGHVTEQLASHCVVL